jgi:hypothetical protein
MSDENQNPMEEHLVEGLADSFSTKKPEPAPQPEPQPEPQYQAQPEPQPAPQPEKKSDGLFDEAKFLESMGLKSKDEIVSLKQKVEELSAVPKSESAIDDPVLFGLNKVKKERPEDFDFFMKLKLNGDVDNLELLVNDYIKRNPTKKDNPDLVKDFIKRKYGLDSKIPKPLDPDDATEEEIEQRNEEIRDAKRAVEFAEMQMEEDVAKVKSAYDQEFEGFLKDFKAPTQENVAEMAKPWEPVAKKFMGNLKKVPVHVPGPEGELQPFLDFTIPEEQMPALEKAIIDYAVSQKLPLEEKSVNKIYEFVVGQVYAANIFKINHAIAERARSMTEEEYDKAYRNPSAIQDPVRQNASTESKHEESVRKAMESEGVIF